MAAFAIGRLRPDHTKAVVFDSSCAGFDPRIDQKHEWCQHDGLPGQSLAAYGGSPGNDAEGFAGRRAGLGGGSFEPRMADDVILETEGLTKEFRGFVAVNDVNLKVRRGTIHALIGPNGAGKTTCFNLLTKFLNPTRGRIRYDGRDITAARPADIARMGLVRSFQISAVFPHLTVLENVRIALQRARGGSFDFWRSRRVLNAFNDRAMALLADVGLASFADWTAVELPYGRKRALEIATTLALDPAMMLLDEPTAGMGHEDIDRIAALIKTVAANRTVLMVEHNLSVVANLSHCITVLTRGRILAEGDYDKVSADPAVKEAYLGVGHE
jgi:branched-chain amino acid transport system ATP-binding protein